jgi:hypothetical protein
MSDSRSSRSFSGFGGTSFGFGSGFGFDGSRSGFFGSTTSFGFGGSGAGGGVSAGGTGFALGGGGGAADGASVDAGSETRSTAITCEASKRECEPGEIITIPSTARCAPADQRTKRRNSRFRRSCCPSRTPVKSHPCAQSRTSVP